MLKRCSSAALLLRNCFPEGATHPLAVPLQVHPPDVVIGSDGGSDFTKVEEEEEEVMLAESSDGFIMPDMKVDWLGSEMEVPSSTSSMEKLVRLDTLALEQVHPFMKVVNSSTNKYMSSAHVSLYDCMMLRWTERREKK